MHKNDVLDLKLFLYPRFSVIVPVYNCKEYLTNCLSSLLAQDYENYEIIIIDDGSTDGSGKICDEYANKFNFIRVTHTENFGCAHARNLALKQLNGDYIFFCDADDIPHPQLFKILSHFINKNHPDVISYKPKDSEKNFEIYDNLDEITVKFFNAVDFGLKIITDDKFNGYLCNKIIKAEYVNKLNFDEDLKMCEDLKFNMELIAQNQNLNIMHLDMELYFYRDWNSVTKRENYYRKSGLSGIVYGWSKVIEIKNLPDEVKKCMKVRLYKKAIGDLFIPPKKMSKQAIEKSQEILQICKQDYFKSDRPLIEKFRIFIKYVLLSNKFTHLMTGKLLSFFKIKFGFYKFWYRRF